MKKILSRRTFIAAIGLSSLASCGQKSEHFESLLAEFLEQLGNQEFTVTLGQVIVSQNKQQFDLQAKEELFNQAFSVSPNQADLLTLKEKIQSEIARDFAAGQVVTIDGWILSVKESTLYALAYLHSSS